MPQNIFNLYSAVAFADQSLVTWPLDDDFSFISLIGASPVWTLTNGASASIANPPKEKPQETVGIADVGILTYDFAASASVMTIEAQSFSNAVTDTTKPTVCVNSFIYTYNANISSIEIGFESASATYSYTTYTGLASDDWTRISHTASVSNSTTIKPYIRIYFSGANRTISLYNFSVGQWSESVNHGSLGSTPTSFSSLSSSATFAQSWGTAFSASPSIYKTYEIDSYGFVDDDNGYYIVEDNRMLAENSNLPMVYGSGNVTNINSSQYSMPSMIFPGKGFLHENGRYGSLTAEFWMKIAPTASASQVKIFGPTGSDDGIYVNQNFIILNIGPYIKSYFVGKWYRPMLIHFTYSPTQATLMINGSTVITQNLNQINIELPNSNIVNTDWIAFYSHSSIKRFQIDSVSIYPYIITSNMAKRKLVYGQGVDNVNDIVKKFGGNPTYVDFAFANYSRNIIYPDNSAWNSGVYSNLEPQDKYLGFIEYNLPELISYGDTSGFVVDRQIRSWDGIKQRIWNYWKSFTWQKLSLSREMELLYDNYQNQSESNERIYFKLKPNSAYANINSAIVLKDSNPLNDSVGSLLGIFSITENEIKEGMDTIENGGLNQSEMILMQFSNLQNKIFKIVISDTDLINKTFKIKYYIESQQINTEIEETISYSSSNTYFIVGLELSKVNIYASTTLKNYFKDMNTIQLSIGGTNSNQFTGRFYRYHINNKFFTLNDTVTSSDLFSEYFDDNGFAKKSTSCVIAGTDGIFDYLSNYTILFKKANKSIVMDIGSAGYWQDSIPMYQLGSYISKPDGQTQFDLDMIQFNMNAPTVFVNNDNADYSSVLDCYVTIQKYQDIGAIPYSTYTDTQELNTNKYLDLENYSKSILDITKFRLVDGTVIFPPKNVVDFKNMYMTFHIRMQTEGININPIQLQNMSIASLSFDNENLYSIKTSNGNDIYPFSRASVTYSPKIKNPFLIYKDSTPYLYLTRDSGIQVLPYDVGIEGIVRGVSIPINSSKKNGFNLYSMQLWMLYNDSYNFSSRQKLFSIYNITYPYNKRITFYLEPEYGNKRAKIVAYENFASQEQLYPNATIYQNGIKQDVYIESLKWTTITIEFSNPIEINNVTAQLELYQGAVFNNIVMYDRSVSDNIDNIFESYLGLSNIVIQDETVLSVDTELLEFYSDIKFTNFSGRML